MLQTFENIDQYMILVQDLFKVVNAKSWSFWWCEQLSICGLSLFHSSMCMLSINFNTMKVKVNGGSAHKDIIMPVLRNHKQTIDKLKLHVQRTLRSKHDDNDKVPEDTSNVEAD